MKAGGEAEVHENFALDNLIDTIGIGKSEPYGHEAPSFRLPTVRSSEVRFFRMPSAFRFNLSTIQSFISLVLYDIQI